MPINEPSSDGAFWSNRHSEHPDFTAYTHRIVEHPAYSGMPDAVREDNSIQWEAPSNRKSGEYQFTHQRRAEWWREKAREVGIDPTANAWISETAKQIHPTGEKPCKRCGRVLKLGYYYPNKNLQRRFAKLPYVEPGDIDPLQDIVTTVRELHAAHGDRIFADLPKLFATRKSKVPDLPGDIEAWATWLAEEYVPSEPSMLSPGAMSNAPDRLDGFHSFNLCCRGKADKGRHDTNMRTYATDRRVFEFWSEGDWIAADRLMGRIRAEFRDVRCRDYEAAGRHEGACDADHIGPLSLGFMHRPEFQLLCSPCNSAKNNRMTLRDVHHLREAERNGERVASWYAHPIWDLRKDDVDDEAKAKRLSRMMRDNQRNAMHLLGRVLEAGHYTFLASLLELGYADRDVDFEGLRIEDHVTRYDDVTYTPRESKQVAKQKARRLRVAFEELHRYRQKENRHQYVVANADVERHVLAALAALQESSEEVRTLDSDLAEHLGSLDERPSERTLQHLAQRVPEEPPHNFRIAKVELEQAMTAVAEALSGMWESSRYVRDRADEFED